MSVTDSLLVGVFGMTVVFAVLIGLSVLIRILAALVGRFSAKKAAQPEAAVTGLTVAQAAPSAPEPLQLKNVDEKTAAMIMAIVCDEMHAQPEELQFKSIRAMDETEGK